jgi:hypothetical protein
MKGERMMPTTQLAPSKNSSNPISTTPRHQSPKQTLASELRDRLRSAQALLSTLERDAATPKEDVLKGVTGTSSLENAVARTRSMVAALMRMLAEIEGRSPSDSANTAP